MPLTPRTAQPYGQNCTGMPATPNRWASSLVPKVGASSALLFIVISRPSGMRLPAGESKASTDILRECLDKRIVFARGILLKSYTPDRRSVRSAAGWSSPISFRESGCSEVRPINDVRDLDEVAHSVSAGTRSRRRYANRQSVRVFAERRVLVVSGLGGARRRAWPPGGGTPHARTVGKLKTRKTHTQVK